MNNLNNYLFRNNIVKSPFTPRSLYQKLWKSSSSSSSSDSDAPKGPKKPTNEEKIAKLNELLTQLTQKDKVVETSGLKLAQPRNKRVKEPAVKPESEETKLVKAVKSVAEHVGGDVKQVESELLIKLLHPSQSQSAGPAKNLMDIVKDMKIDRETKPARHSRADEVKNILQRMQGRTAKEFVPERKKLRPLQPKQERIEKIDLFGSESLGVFSTKSQLKEVPGNETWNALYNRDLKLAVTHPPANYFQEMILWTEQGKLWKFPIDNEQGLEDEKNVSFDQHIFLESHLEPWCPQKGPIRHFMELVCVGLSKNPYLTVEAKKEHIEWYRDYFKGKEKLLQEVGAIPSDMKSSQKQIE